MSGKILIVEDKKENLSQYCRLLQEAGYEVKGVEKGEEAVEVAKKDSFDLLLADWKLGSGIDGLETYKRINEIDPDILFILITGWADLESAIKAFRLGAYDYLIKDKDGIDRIEQTVRRAIDHRGLKRENVVLRHRLAEKEKFDEIIGNSSYINEIKRRIEIVAPSDASVLITGENGAGKGLIANAIHKQSPRREKPLIVVNCAAIPETLLESDLFGHEKGAFTGATARRLGKFELANESTIFLDEICDMSPATQAKVLRVLQEREFERVGGTETIKVNVRIIAATNKDIQKQIQEGKFREDLFYRLNVIPIHVPPLRERKEDIPPLVEHFLLKYNAAAKHIAGFSSEVMDLFHGYSWRGNIRELENLVERGIVVCQGGTIELHHIGMDVLVVADESESDPIDSEQKKAKDEMIKKVLEKHHGNVAAAARELKRAREPLSKYINSDPELKRFLEKLRKQYLTEG